MKRIKEIADRAPLLPGEIVHSYFYNMIVI